MVSLIAEDLLLLLLDEDKGTVRAGSYLTSALGGAVLVELALSEAVAVEEKIGIWRNAKVRVTATAAVADPVLTTGLATVAEKDRTPQDLVNRLGKGLKETLTTRLVEREGVPSRELKKRAKVIGQGDWAAKAVRDAVAATIAAVSAAGMAATVAATSGS